jgi:hypothetical protein
VVFLISPPSHVIPFLSCSMEALKERLKDKLREKLKPKLRLNYFKHRRESSSQVVPWVPTKGVALSHEDGEAAHVAQYAHMKPFVNDFTPLRVLPAGVKSEPEQGTLDPTSSFFSLGRESTGELVVANVSLQRVYCNLLGKDLYPRNLFAVPWEITLISARPSDCKHLRP